MKYAIVTCDECGKPAIRKAAVKWLGKWLHPFKCFDLAFERFRLALSTAEKEHLQ